MVQLVLINQQTVEHITVNARLISMVKIVSIKSRVNCAVVVTKTALNVALGATMASVVFHICTTQIQFQYIVQHLVEYVKTYVVINKQTVLSGKIWDCVLK